MKTPEISVIVPAYNAERTLGKSVESILVQNYVKFELLLVDDGSTDRTPAICDDYASMDSRVRVIHQMNCGVAAARNAALERACGGMVCFVDADDWVGVNYLGNMVDGMDEETDLVIAFPQYPSNTKSKARDYPATVINDSNFAALFSRYDMHLNTGPWAKLFKREIIKRWNIRFPGDMKLGEDCVFIYDYLLHSKQIRIIDSKDYCYNVNNDTSLTKQSYCLKYEMNLYSRIERSADLLIEGKNITDPVTISMLWRLKNHYLRRVLNAIYISESLPAQSRRAIIRSFDNGAYEKIAYVNSVRENIFRFLLKHKWFWIYDSVRKIVSGIKRRKL